jgi:hypothetical protein
LILDAELIMHWLDQAEGMIEKPFEHFTDHVAYCQALGRAAEEKARIAAIEVERRENKHIVGIREYWREQQPGGLFLEGDHIQAHLCLKCVRYHAATEHEAPCYFAYHPLENQWSGSAMPPAFGVMVREDGLMVPRCEQFRLADVLGAGILPAAGFVLADRKVVLGWMHRIAVIPNRHEHNHTMAGPLAWLPYKRPDEGTTHHLDGLLRWLRDAWEDLGDERMATLISVVAQEGKALSSYRNPFELMDSTTGEVERWCSVPWERVVSREDFDQWGYRDWPDGWPKPWVRENVES